MKYKNKRWQKIVKEKLAKVPFRKEYCVCGKRSFTKGEGERYRKFETKGNKKKAHIYQCPESFDYHLTYKTS